MNARHFVSPVFSLVLLWSCPLVAATGVHRLTVAGDRLEFMPQPERGYVVKLAEKTGGIHALAGLPVLDAENAREIGGLDRRGVWTVENAGPASRNEDTIRSLRASGQVAYATPLFSSNGETIAIIPEIVVRVKLGTDVARVEALCEEAGCRVIKRMEFTQQEHLLEVLGPDADAVFTAVEELGQAPEVEWACPNTAFRLKLGGQTLPGNQDSGRQVQIASGAEDPNIRGVFPNDEYFPKQWHLHNTGQSGGTPGADVRAPEAWEITTGDPNIVIAIIGVGVDTHHPDLVSNLVAGYDFFEDDNTPDPGNSGAWEDAHDTVCAGMIAARGNNGIGVAGVAYNCKIMPIRVGSATTWGDGSKIATSFRWAAAHGADVLSNSWAWSKSPTPYIYSAIADVTKPGGLGRGGRGCVVVFAAGNDGGPMTEYPPLYSEVIAVGATDHNDMLWSYSSCGPKMDVVAPAGCDGTWCGQMATCWSTDQMGVGGYSDRNSDARILDYTEYSGGTSFSCPIVAGAAALILSIEPGLDSNDVGHFLVRSAKDLGDPSRDDYYGWGRVDVRGALDMVLAKRADLNGDWVVDENDLATLTAALDTNDLSADIAPAAKRDGVLDARDRDLLMRYLGTRIPPRPEPGLIAHWALDETEGQVAHSSVVIYEAVTPSARVQGEPVWQPDGGKVGGALQFDGVDDCLTTQLIRDPSEGPFTVLAWVKGGAPGQVILSQDKGANWLVAAVPNGVLTTELQGAGRSGKPLASRAVVTDGEWHRVGLVWDGSSRALHVDSVEVARDTQTTMGGTYWGLHLGAGSNMAPTSFWKGLIDDVRIYNRAVKP